MARPLAVAITGGIGAGKSEALAAFARHGAATISSDEVVHELYADADVSEALRERYGDGIFDGDKVIRAALGAIVFADRSELAWLERLLHPKVMARTEAWRQELAALPDPPALHQPGCEGGSGAAWAVAICAGRRRATRRQVRLEGR